MAAVQGDSYVTLPIVDVITVAAKGLLLPAE